MGRAAEDGASARLRLLGATVANGTAGTLFSWSVFLPPVGEELARGEDELGVVLSTALVAFALAMLLAGGAVDRHGPRRAAAVAGALCASGLGLAASSQGVLTLHLGIGVLFGAGSGLTYLATVSWAGRSGPGRATRTGLVVASYAAGPVVAAPLGSAAADTWGWRPTLAVAAVVVGGAVLLAGLALPGAAVAHPGRAPGSSTSTTEPGGDPPALAALWVMFLAAAAPGLLAFAYAAPVAAEAGVPIAQAGVVVALMAAGNLAGRLLSAPLSHLVGSLPALWGTVVALGCALVVLALPSADVLVVSALVLLAFQYGLVSALLPGAVRVVSGGSRFATAYGRVFSSFGVAAVAGPLLGTFLHSASDGYTAAFRASLVAPVLVAVALLAYRRRLTGAR